MKAVEMDCNEIQDHVQRLVDAETVTGLANRLGVARQTVYNILAGTWPSRELMDKLEIRLIWRKR